ncbi:MAG TPA: HD domain-containing phosphohydrolase, partial [Longimicrobiales bacterium]|nr:HD domain-containing phosphohydrolase [Longimicrobiales bacterium]
LAERLSRARILVVDDEPANIELLRRILEPEGYPELLTTTDPTEVVDLYRENDPDLVLLDVMMPGIDGFKVLENLRDEGSTAAFLPVLVLTSDHTHEAKRRALAGGAKDFLTKPLSPAEVRLRVRNLLETRFLHLELQDQNRLLEERVRDRTADLERARYETLERLARAAEYRDDETGEHTRRVGRLAARVAEALGWPEERSEMIFRVAPLHDVGKIGIPDSILLNPGSLSDEEFRIMQTHTTIGAELLGGSEFPLMHMAEEIALAHHERWDGGGYPHGLSGEEIPPAGRIVGVADTFDALTTARPYKEAWSLERTMKEIRSQRGGQFDPDVVDALEAVLSEAGPEVVRRGRKYLREISV